jgi:hypothetical protein
MTRELVDIITRSQRLEHLELNNLSQWSEIAPPLPQCTSARNLEIYWDLFSSYHNALEDTRHMAGALDALQGRCSLLTSLSISTVGDGSNISHTNAWDDRRDASWALFLDSVRNQLYYLTFKQGVCRNDDSAGGRPGPPRYRRQRYRIMDERFRSSILPVLLAAEWPKMKSMDFKGIGGYTVHEPWEEWSSQGRVAEEGVTCRLYDEPLHTSPQQCFMRVTRSAFPATERQKLRALLPDGAELVIEEEEEKDYEDIKHERYALPY